MTEDGSSCGFWGPSREFSNLRVVLGPVSNFMPGNCVRSKVWDAQTHNTCAH